MGGSSSKEEEETLSAAPVQVDPFDNMTVSSPIALKEEKATYDLLEELRGDPLGVRGTAMVPLDNSAFAEYEFQPLELPVDEDGFVVSFDVSDRDGIRAFYEQYGVVVVREVLSADECARSVDEQWAFLERHSSGVERGRPETWGTGNWMSLSKLGILGNTIWLSEQSFRNRVQQTMHEAFAAVMGTERLWMNVGRCSMMRPTRRVVLPAAMVVGDIEERIARGMATRAELDALEYADEEHVVVDMPEWKTAANWLHLDANPFTGECTSFSWRRVGPGNAGYDDERVQGIVALEDCALDDGGFHCVPGVARDIRGWAAANQEAHFNPEQHDTTHQIPKGDPMRDYIQRCPIRAGSLLVWSSFTPHGSYPNDSAHGRHVQYVKASLVDQDYWRPLFDDETLMPPGLGASLDVRERRLLGLDPYPPLPQ